MRWCPSVFDAQPARILQHKATIVNIGHLTPPLYKNLVCSFLYLLQVLKGTSVSLWVRNMQLSGFGILLGAGCVWFKDGQAVSENGFFYG